MLCLCVALEDNFSLTSFMPKPSSLLGFPVLGALSVLLGVLLERAGLRFWFVFVVAVAAVPLWFLRVPQAVRIALVVALLCCPLAWWRSHTSHSADNLEPFLGKTVVLEGDFDGRFLTSASGRVLLRSRKDLAMGAYRISGKLEKPQWYRNPGAFDVGAWLAARDVRYVLRVKSAEALPNSFLNTVRTWVRTGVRTGLQPREAALMTGIALGDADELNGLAVSESESWRDIFAKSGLAHIMALSGQQVTILIVALSWLLRGLLLWRFPALMMLLVAYWAVVGTAPSVSRAVVMGLAVLLVGWLGRGKLEALPALGLSAIFTLLLQPSWVADIGWMLSYLAVLGMIFFVPLLLERLGLQQPDSDQPIWIRVRYWATALIIATVAAQTLTLPLTASGFGMIPVVSPISNVFAEVLVTPLVILSFFAGLLGQFSLPINFVVQFVAFALLEIAKFFAQAPILEWGTIGVLGFVAYYSSMTALYCWLLRWIRPYQMLAVLLAAVLITALAKRSRAEIIYFDVGQGDATLIRLPVGDILIDGGGTPQTDFDIGRRVMIPALRSLGVKNLTVIATHADADHVEGLTPVLQHFAISSLIIGHDKTTGEDAVWDVVMAAARAKNIPVRAVQNGMDWQLGEAKIHFFNPQPNPLPEDNANSVAFSLEYLGKRFLFLGDVPSDIEDTMNPGALDVLKLAHHGSRFSTGETLMRRTQPKAVVVSSGLGNTYGHPSQVVLERVKRYRSQVFRTDLQGAIIYNFSTGQFVTLTAP